MCDHAFLSISSWYHFFKHFVSAPISTIVFLFFACVHKYRWRTTALWHWKTWRNISNITFRLQRQTTTWSSGLKNRRVVPCLHSKLFPEVGSVDCFFWKQVTRSYYDWPCVTYKSDLVSAREQRLYLVECNDLLAAWLSGKNVGL